MLPALIAGGALVGSYLANKSAADRQNDLNDKAFQEFIKINIPDPEQQKIALQKYVVEGKLDPILENAIKQNPSEFENVVASQDQKNAQSRALSSLEQIGNEGGMRLQDKAALQESMMKGAVRDRGNRLAINDEMARRGQGGSGFALQAQLEGQQATGDRDAMSGLSAAASAQDRALKAIQGSGELATQYRGQDVKEQQAKAEAQDAINRFNAQNLQGVQHANVGYQNQANQMNLQNQQNISNKNVDTSNEQEKYNKGLAQQQYENQMKMAQSKAGLYSDQGKAAQQQGAQMTQAIGNAGSGGVGMATAAENQSWQTDENQKNRDAWAKFKGYP